jgi:hypothetical protein
MASDFSVQDVNNVYNDGKERGVSTGLQNGIFSNPKIIIWVNFVRAGNGKCWSIL